MRFLALLVRVRWVLLLAALVGFVIGFVSPAYAQAPDVRCILYSNITCDEGEAYVDILYERSKKTPRENYHFHIVRFLWPSEHQFRLFERHNAYEGDPEVNGSNLGSAYFLENATCLDRSEIFHARPQLHEDFACYRGCEYEGVFNAGFPEKCSPADSCSSLRPTGNVCDAGNSSGPVWEYPEDPEPEDPDPEDPDPEDPDPEDPDPEDPGGPGGGGDDGGGDNGGGGDDGGGDNGGGDNGGGGDDGGQDMAETNSILRDIRGGIGDIKDWLTGGDIGEAPDPWIGEVGVGDQSWSSGLGAGSCPPPITTTVSLMGQDAPIEFSFQPLCDLAGLLRTLVRALGAIVAMYIIAGVRR